MKKLVLALAAVSTMGTAALAGSNTIINNGPYDVRVVYPQGHLTIHWGEAATFYSGIKFKMNCYVGGLWDIPVYTDKHHYIHTSGICPNPTFTESDAGHPTLKNDHIPEHASKRAIGAYK